MKKSNKYFLTAAVGLTKEIVFSLFITGLGAALAAAFAG